MYVYMYIYRMNQKKIEAIYIVVIIPQFLQQQKKKKEIIFHSLPDTLKQTNRKK